MKYFSYPKWAFDPDDIITSESTKQRGLIEELSLPSSEEDVESASKAYVTSPFTSSKNGIAST
jgi:hypothetical protein